MCTVLLRWAPGEPWPLLLGAIRDEFADRSWDPPAPHWTGDWAHLIGGRDHTAGGTWLAVDPTGPAVSALLNGPRRPPPTDGVRPTRGDLALRVLSGDLPADLGPFDRFHLLRADHQRAELWSWDGDAVAQAPIEPGPHIVVNAGLDVPTDPLVPHFAPLLAALPAPGPDLTDARRAWLGLLAGDGLDPGDERALVVRKEVDGRAYASTSAAFVALSASRARYDFTSAPADPASWVEVAVP